MHGLGIGARKKKSHSLGCRRGPRPSATRPRPASTANGVPTAQRLAPLPHATAQVREAYLAHRHMQHSWLYGVLTAVCTCTCPWLTPPSVAEPSPCVYSCAMHALYEREHPRRSVQTTSASGACLHCSGTCMRPKRPFITRSATPRRS